MDGRAEPAASLSSLLPQRRLRKHPPRSQPSPKGEGGCVHPHQSTGGAAAGRAGRPRSPAARTVPPALRPGPRPGPRPAPAPGAQLPSRYVPEPQPSPETRSPRRPVTIATARRRSPRPRPRVPADPRPVPAPQARVRSGRQGRPSPRPRTHRGPPAPRTGDTASGTTTSCPRPARAARSWRTSLTPRRSRSWCRYPGRPAALTKGSGVGRVGRCAALWVGGLISIGGEACRAQASSARSAGPHLHMGRGLRGCEQVCPRGSLSLA